MMRKTVLLFAALVVGSSAAPVEAGYVSLDPVYISPHDYAQGSVAGARLSGNSVEYIHCRVRDKADIISGESDPSVICYARNASGTTRTCYSFDPAQVEIASGINASSRIHFSWVHIFGSALCEDLEVTNGSLYTE